MEKHKRKERSELYLVTPTFFCKSDKAKTSEWAFQWKMSFNPDPTKAAQKVIFGRKLKAVPHPSKTFNSDVFRGYRNVTLD